MKPKRRAALVRRVLVVVTMALGFAIASALPSGASTGRNRGNDPARPVIESVHLSRHSLSPRGGTVEVTTLTTKALTCRLEPVGHLVSTTAAPRAWTNCSKGRARATVDIGPNPGGATIFVRLRDDARGLRGVTYRTLTIVLRTGPTGTPAPPGIAGPSQSTNWSGYVVPSSSSPFESVSGEWTVPTLDCSDTPNGSVSEWVGVGGVTWPGGASAGALLQTGTDEDCVNGSQFNDAWWELYPSEPNHSIEFETLSLSPGDEVSAEIYKTSSGRWATRVDDVTEQVSGTLVVGEAYGIATNGQVFSYEGSAARLYFGGGYSAEWIVEDQGQTETSLAPFANYGSVAFTNLQTSLPSWVLTTQDEVEMVQNGTTLSVPSAPQTNAFDVRYTGT